MFEQLVSFIGLTPPYPLWWLFLFTVVQVIIAPIPSDFAIAYYGSLYSALQVTLIAGTGLFIGNLIAYYIGYKLEGLTRKIIDAKTLQKFEARVQKFGFKYLLTLRFIPFAPYDPISYFAGFLKIDKKLFVIMTFLTAYTKAFLLASFGGFLITKSFALGVIFLIVLTIVLTWLLEDLEKRLNIEKLTAFTLKYKELYKLSSDRRNEIYKKYKERIKFLMKKQKDYEKVVERIEKVEEKIKEEEKKEELKEEEREEEKVKKEAEEKEAKAEEEKKD